MSSQNLTKVNSRGSKLSKQDFIRPSAYQAAKDIDASKLSSPRGNQRNTPSPKPPKDGIARRASAPLAAAGPAAPIGPGEDKASEAVKKQADIPEEEGWDYVVPRRALKKKDAAGAIRNVAGPVLSAKPRARRYASSPADLSEKPKAYALPMSRQGSRRSAIEDAAELGPSVRNTQGDSKLQTIPAWKDVAFQQPVTAARATTSAVAVTADPLESFTLSKMDSFETESVERSSIFDDEEQDAPHSDFATDVSGSSISSGGRRVPEGVDPDERLMNPSRYFGELEDLEMSIAANSGLFLMREVNRQRYPGNGIPHLNFSYEGHCSGDTDTDSKDYDDAIMPFVTAHLKSASGTKSKALVSHGSIPMEDLALLAFDLLECRNLLLSIIANLKRMERAEYCNGTINFFTVSEHRPSVAELSAIGLSAIYELHRHFEAAIASLAGAVKESKPTLSSELRSSLHQLTSKCRDIVNPTDLPQPKHDASIWRQTLLLLDLAVISYSGAHTERFDVKNLGEDLDYARIPSAWTYATDGSDGIMLRRRYLRCLNRYLGGSPVWVFQPARLWQDRDPLYLGTSADQFADIWGPAWAIKQSEDAADVLRYSTEGGAILAWPASEGVPKLNTNEVFCHWARTGEARSASPSSIPQNAKLLIGGCEVEKRTSQLKINEQCSNRTERVIEQLRSKHLLEDLDTRDASYYVAEEQLQMSVGAYGVSLGGSKVYKRREGVSLKESICAAWINGTAKRNPHILDQWLGVEVSFCSRNARRCRLKQLFTSTTMKHWIDACRTQSEPFPCEKVFNEALEDDRPGLFGELWDKHKEWRDDMGKLVAWSLEGLGHSTVDDDGNLKALWIPRAHRKFRVIVKRERHSWAPFLGDGREQCAFAIMSGKCLHTDHAEFMGCKEGSRRPGFTFLETALMINDEASKPKALEKKRVRLSDKNKQLSRYSISSLRAGDTFTLPQGRLIVTGLHPIYENTRLLCRYEAGIFKKLHDAGKQLAKTVGKETKWHWEHQDDEFATTKPIPVFIISHSVASK